MRQDFLIKRSETPKCVKTIGLALAALICLSACGVKGDLKRPGPIFDKNKTQTETPVETPSTDSSAINSSNTNSSGTDLANLAETAP